MRTVASSHLLVRPALPASVRLVQPPDGLPHLLVHSAAARAQVFFHGAQVTQWTPAGADTSVLWLSAESVFRAGKAIRGGVPICFPWFGPHRAEAAAPAHGFARFADWTLIECADGATGVTLVFELLVDEHTSRYWRHPCRVVFRAIVGATLEMSLEVENTGPQAFTFEQALHSYLAVSDVREVTVSGLEGTDYLDKVDGFARKPQGADPIRFSAQTDRVYLDTTARCIVHDPGARRAIVVDKSRSRSTVVWNPWAEKAATFDDFGDDEWPRMLCVETANIRDAAVELPPGGRHHMEARISAIPPARLADAVQ